MTGIERFPALTRSNHLPWQNNHSAFNSRTSACLPTKIRLHWTRPFP